MDIPGGARLRQGCRDRQSPMRPSSVSIFTRPLPPPIHRTHRFRALSPRLSLASGKAKPESAPIESHLPPAVSFFSSTADIDGAIAAANDLAAATATLYVPEELMTGRATELLIALMQSQRSDAQVAAAHAATTAFRFETMQVEWVAQQGVAPLAAVLSTGSPEAQLEACRAVQGVAAHRDGREELARAGAVKALLRIARDELHIGQEHAAAALAIAVGLESAVTHRALPTLSTKTARRVAPSGATQPPGRRAGGSRAGATSAAGAAASSSSSSQQQQQQQQQHRSSPSRHPASSSHAATGAHASDDAIDAVTIAGEEAIDSFVVMAMRGGAVAREQAANGLRHLCHDAEGRQRLVAAGAILIIGRIGKEEA